MHRTLLPSGALLVAAVIGLALPAAAYVPPAERVEGAVVKTNRAGSRRTALRLEIELKVEEGSVVGRGEIVSHPTGLARLELRGGSGVVERHLLRGSEHLASRNGERLSDPRNFLPPLFLLQISSSTALRAALRNLGAEPDAIGLAPCGESDCYVIGDPRRSAPKPNPIALEGADGEGALGGGFAAAFGGLASDARTDPLRASYATLWVDIEDYEVVGIQSESGVKVRLGPPAVFERVRVPSWIEIEEPGRGLMRFEVVSGGPVDAPAAAFGESWLESPELFQQPAPDSPGHGSQLNPDPRIRENP